MSLGRAILGFLKLAPTTGYTLRQRFEGSVGSFWSVTQSQIYRELHGLEQDGLVTARVEPSPGKPDRKLYALTAKGRRALRAWLTEPLEPLQLRHPLLLKLVFAAEMAPDELDAVLTHYGASIGRTRADYAARLTSRDIFSLARSKREATIWRLTIEHGLAWCDAELSWLKQARTTLGSRTLNRGQGSA